MSPVEPRKRIGVIIPTRGRPGNVERLRDAFYATRELKSTELIWCGDSDDPTRQSLEELLPDCVVIGRRKSMPAWTNFACGLYRDQFDIFASWGDDHVPRTQGWDRVMAEVLEEDGPGIAFGNDGYQGPRLPTAPFISKEIIAALGFMCPPGFQHMFVDNYWRELGKMTGRLLYCPWVMIEHVHPKAGKSAWDNGYRRVAALEAGDQAVAAQYEASGNLQRDIDKVIGALGVVAEGH